MSGYAVVALWRPKHECNVGGALRAAHVFGGAMVVIQGSRVRRIGRIATDTMKTHRHIPVLKVEDLHAVVPHDCVPVAVDIVDGAVSLPDYVHPERAFYVFGPEDGTLGKAVLSWCRDKIVIPSSGCLNLAAAVNVVLYDRAAKRGHNGGAAR